MSKNDEYRANADECQRMARLSRNDADKRRWLDMAQHWLSMIKPRQSASEKFDALERERGTNQQKSDKSH